MKYSEHVKKKLLTLIQDMDKISWLFVRNPDKDFTRKRKFGFEDYFRFLLSLESGSVQTELLKFFDYDSETITLPAFIQQRDKILPEAMEFLFHEFNDAFSSIKHYHGYRLLACDGSELNIARNPKDTETFFQHSEHDKGYNQLHLNTLYDLIDRRCVDAVIQPGRKKNESKAMTEMIDRYTGNEKTIFIADRGYETYNIFAHTEKKNMYYLIRVKDGSSGGMVSGFQTPDTNEFDYTESFILTRKRTKEVKSNPILYKRIRKNSPFDYLDLDENLFYPISFRVVRFMITEGSYECVITNLPEEEFPPEELKKLYNMRWGIETAFRELKYTVGLSYFHSKKVEYILPEIYARLIVYNFCELITMAIVIQQKETKYMYQVNYTRSIQICRYFFRCKQDISPPNVETLIQKNLLPIRPGRKNPRKVKARSFISFLYRVV